MIVFLAAILCLVMQRWGGVLRDETQNGCEGDYSDEGTRKIANELYEAGQAVLPYIDVLYFIYYLTSMFYVISL